MANGAQQYLGIASTEEGDWSRYLQHTRRWASRYAKCQTHCRAGIAVKADDDRIEAGESTAGLCLVDGHLSLESGSKRETQQNRAVATLEAWISRGSRFLSSAEITASLGLWNETASKLALVRPHHGIPPVFYTEKNGTLLWSNSIRVLLRHGVEAKMDRCALDAYFAMGYVPSPWTLLKGIRKVPAGQFLEWNCGETNLRRHWRPVSQSRAARNVQARTEQLKDRLCQSLDEMVKGYDRVGVLLSSGVDSSLLVGLLHCELGVPVEAFTFQYSGYEGKYNEYDRARRLTRLYDLPHHKIDYSAEWLKDNFSRTVRDYEEPFSYGNHTARLKEVNDADISLLLNGILPQSSFISRTATFALRVGGSPARSVGRWGRYLLQRWCPKGHSRFRHAVNVAASSAEDLFYSLVQDTVVSEADRKKLYAEDRRLDIGRESMLRLFEREVHDSGLNRKAERLAHLRNQFALPDHLMWWHYRWAQANNLTTGAPYVHSDVRSWMQSLRQPVWPLHQEWVGKALIREAAASLMPEDIAHEPKIAQSVPFWRWFQGPLRPLLFEYLKPSRLEKIGLFNLDFVQQALQQHMTGKVSRPYLLWTLLCFMVWEDEFLEGKHTK